MKRRTRANQMSTMKGSAAEVLVRYLEQEGVQYVFGLPGGHLLTLYDAINRSRRITSVLAKNEQGAGYMANGYARVSGRPGVCCATVGPGATNLVSGVAAAYMDSTPLLVLTAQVGTTAIGKGALQEAAGDGRTVDHVAMFRPITKYSAMVTRSILVSEAMRKALRIATSGRPGPVHLDLPSDVLKADVEETIIPPARYRAARLPTIDRDQVEDVVRLLISARRPAILAGGGVIAAGGQGELLRLAERLDIPVATSLRGKGAVPEDHALALGCLGLYGTRAANSYLRSGIDVLLAAGVSFHEMTTHCWDPAFQPTTALVQVDIDPAEIGKNYPVDVALVGDARVALQGVVQALERRGDVMPSGRRRDALRVFKRAHEYFSEPAMASDSVPLKPQRVMRELRETLPPETIVFSDIGNSLTWVERCFPVHGSGSIVSMSGLAAMGSGVAGVIGGKLAAPDRPVVCLCGDGDFQMTGLEMITAVAHGVPAIWVILNNARLGMIYDIQNGMYHGRIESSTLRNPDFAALARAMGADGHRIERPGELRTTLCEALAAGRPTLIDVPIDPDELPPLKPRMLALERSVGLPSPAQALSWKLIKATRAMLREH